LSEAREEKAQRRTSHERSPSVDTVSSNSTYANSDTETDLEKREDSPARNTRSKTAAAALEKDEIKPQNKSIRIKLHNEEALLKRKAQKAQQRSRGNAEDVEKVASSLKSPSSGPTTKMTRYPRTPAPPRPLVPRRQPSYSMSYPTEGPKKTLVIDLDETLIHSMAKGGRMSTGHMVEVRLGGPVSNSGVSLGPGVPILYFVHERPHCHEFLRKVCKWYNLIVFTASVQEYADPVIDWLERERKYFSGRYYRQHCTYRNGAYIKDLAQVEPDLSRVMILDNSPMSYIFHEGKRCLIQRDDTL
jgi:CTD nuclear envelope phosphatase 1